MNDKSDALDLISANASRLADYARRVLLPDEPDEQTMKIVRGELDDYMARLSHYRERF